MTARANTATANASHVRSNMPSASSSLKTSRSFNSFKDVIVQRPPDKDFLVDVTNNVSGNSHAKTPHHLPLSLHNLNLNYLKNILAKHKQVSSCQQTPIKSPTKPTSTIILPQINRKDETTTLTDENNNNVNSHEKRSNRLKSATSRRTKTTSSLLKLKSHFQL